MVAGFDEAPVDEVAHFDQSTTRFLGGIKEYTIGEVLATPPSPTDVLRLQATLSGAFGLALETTMKGFLDEYHGRFSQQRNIEGAIEPPLPAELRILWDFPVKPYLRVQVVQ